MLIRERIFRSKDGRSHVMRTAMPADANLVLDFVRLLLRESHRFLNNGPTTFDSVSEDFEAAFLQRYVDHASNFMAIVMSEERVIANLTFTAQNLPCESHCGQLGMGVLQEFQGQGVGKELLLHALNEAQRVGVWNVQLQVRTGNARAIGLYESVGFERVGTLAAVARIEGDWVDNYLYQKLAIAPPS